MQVIDSHTGGEPTRVVVAGGPDLGAGPMAERAARLAADFDHCRAGIVTEPRGSDVMVGALLCSPHAESCDAGVIFFNNVGVLGMCGHGTIGLAVTLRRLGRAGRGTLRLDTPVGVVIATLLDDDHRVQIENVPSRRYRAGVRVRVPDWGEVVGDVAWGGNWFFLTDSIPIPLDWRCVEALTACSKVIRRELLRQGVTGAAGAEIDHVELLGPAKGGGSGRGFVLCPGGAYDRSPCGTGTSAKLACLAADGKLAPGENWRQESVIGSVFSAAYELGSGDAWPALGEASPEVDRDAPWIVPQITGSAYVTAETTLIFDDNDPFRWGLETTARPGGQEPGDD